MKTVKLVVPKWDSTGEGDHASKLVSDMKIKKKPRKTPMRKKLNKNNNEAIVQLATSAIKKNRQNKISPNEKGKRMCLLKVQKVEDQTDKRHIKKSRKRVNKNANSKSNQNPSAVDAQKQITKTKMTLMCKNDPFLINRNKKLNSSHKVNKNVSHAYRNEDNRITSKKTKGRTKGTLRENMMNRLNAARFRYINEELYTTSNGNQAMQYFAENPSAYGTYHEGFRQQADQWPINPVDVVIQSVRKLPKSHIVADFGCGEAKLAQTLPHKVHSFDLMALNNHVTVCDMSKVPLPNETVDVTVFCLSLMGSKLREYIVEASRVLKIGGILKIAEVESRFHSVDQFTRSIEACGFSKVSKNLSHEMFYFMDFKKTRNILKRKGLPEITLKPCLYKRR